MVFVPAVSTFVISRMLGGGSNLLIGDLIEMQFLGNSYNLNVGSAMSLVLMIIVLLCMSFTSSFDEIRDGGCVLMKTKHLRLMQRAYVILVFCFMYLPIAVHDRVQLQREQGLFALHRLYPQVVHQPVPQLVHPACAAGSRLRWL